MFSVKKKRTTKKAKSKTLGAIHLAPTRTRTQKKNLTGTKRKKKYSIFTAPPDLGQPLPPLATACHRLPLHNMPPVATSTLNWEDDIWSILSTGTEDEGNEEPAPVEFCGTCCAATSKLWYGGKRVICLLTL